MKLPDEKWSANPQGESGDIRPRAIAPTATQPEAIGGAKRVYRAARHGVAYPLPDGNPAVSASAAHPDAAPLRPAWELGAENPPKGADALADPHPDSTHPTDAYLPPIASPTAAEPSFPPVPADAIDDPYTHEWQELLATLQREHVIAGQPLATAGAGSAFPQANQPPSAQPTPKASTASQPDETTGGYQLSPKDFAMAFGKGHPDVQSVDPEVANAFARAWAEGESVIKYDGAYHAEADMPPTKDSRAAAGWLPEEETDVAPAVVAPFAPLSRKPADEADDNQLFETYGASYAEAYAVALSLKFNETKPLPDDNTGDVTGPTSSILHTPSGEPIVLGTVAQEDYSDDLSVDASVARKRAGSFSGEPSLSVGRKFVRYTLLALAAVTVIAVGLYFAGVIA